MGIRIGDETVAPAMTDMVFEDLDIIFASGPIAINVVDGAAVSNILFENIRCPKDFPAYLFEIQNTKNEYSYDKTNFGTFDQILFRNIWSMRDPNSTAAIKGASASNPVTNVTFEGVVCGPNKNRFTEQKWACTNYSNIKYSPGGATPGQVSNRAVKNIGQDSAFIAWDILPPLYKSFELRYRKSGNADWEIAIGTSKNGYQLSQLKPGTTYEWQVRSISTSGTSEWSYTRIFTTALETSTSISHQTIINPENLIRIYPNPTSDRVKITLSEAFNTDYKVEIYNSKGQLLQQFEKRLNEQNFELSLKAFVNGTLFVKLSNDQKSYTVQVRKAG